MKDTDRSREWTKSVVPVGWRRCTRVPPLLAGQIQLWWAGLAAAAPEYERLASLLSTHERRRAQRFRFDRHRVAYTVARGGLRVLLGALLQRAPESIEFDYGELGKPSLAPGSDGRRLCFNYSDSGGHALYGFAWDCELGVDLERLGRKTRWEHIARRRFSATEARALCAYPAALNGDAFLTCWTRKEAYGKALGRGIHYPLNSVELCGDCRSLTHSVNGWRLRQIYPETDFVGCIVHQTRRTDLELFCSRLDTALLQI